MDNNSQSRSNSNENLYILKEQRINQGDFDNDRFHNEKKTDIPAATANLVHVIVGAGILAMPYSLEQAGIVPGCLLFVIVAAITDRTLVHLVAAGKSVGVSSFQETAEIAFGKTGRILCVVLQFSVPSVTVIMCNIIVGDTMTKVIYHLGGESVIWIPRELVMAVANVALVLPLSCLKTLAYMSQASLASIGLVFFVTACICARAPTMAQLAVGHVGSLSWAGSGLGSAIGVIATAFECQHATFTVFNTLGDNTPTRWQRTCHGGVGIALLLTIVMAFAGYLPFRELTQGDILNNYCWSDPLINVCRILFCIAVLMVIPIEVIVCRDVLETLFFKSSQPPPFWRHALLTTVLTIGGFGVSCATDCLASVQGVMGIFASVPISFLLPSSIFIKLTDGPAFCKAKIGAWCIIACGVVVMLVGIVDICLHFDRISTCVGAKEMVYCQSIDNSSVSFNWTAKNYR